MAASDKITGKDLFDVSSIKAAYDRFKKWNKDAERQVDALKQSIIELNTALASGKTNQYNTKMRRLQSTLRQVSATNRKLRQDQRLLSNQFDRSKISVSKLTVQLKKLEIQQRRTKKSGGGLFSSGLKSLSAFNLGLTGIVFGLIRVTKEVFNTSKALDSINLTLGKVTDSSYEFAKSQKFLADISEKFGLNLLNASKKFSTFTASAKQSGFTLNETMEIFETFSNAGASLGRSAAELDRIFLALEQMMSKNKVSSEELRRQLGEVLPGAVSIMAKSMGVSNSVLEKMLKNGEVIAEDVLPAFAKEVEKTFSLDNAEKIGTLASEQERLNNAFTNFVDAIAGSETLLNKFFNGTLSLGSRILNTMADMFNDMGTAIKADTSIFQKFADVLAVSLGFNTDFIDSVKKAGEFKEVNEGLLKYSELIRLAAKEAKLAGKEFDSNVFTSLIERVTIGGKDDIPRLKKESEEYVDTMIDYYNKEIIKLNKPGGKGTDSRSLMKQVVKETKGSIVLLEDMFNDLFEDLLTAQDGWNKAETEKDKAFWRGKIFRAEKAANELGLILQPLTFTDTTGLNDRLPEGQKGLNKKQQRAKNVEGNENVLATALGVSDEDLKKLGKNIEKGLQAAAEFNDALAALSDAKFAQEEQKIDEEEKRLNAFYDAKLKLAEGDADLIDKINIRKAADEEKLEKKRQKLEYDKAKAKKQQSIIDAAINTAIGITAALTLVPAGFVLAAIIAATGAIQIAAISAQPLPKYADGTGFHKGGKAIVGDGGKRELMISPSGGLAISDSKAHVVDMERGSQVIPDAQAYINNQVMRTILAMDDRGNEILVDKITDAVIQGFSKAKVNNHNNIKVGIDHALWKNQVINGN